MNKPKPEPKMNPNAPEWFKTYVQDMFESNRSASAMLRDGEAESARRASPLLDLRTIPREQWDKHLNSELVLPPGIARFLAGDLTDTPPAFPLTTQQVHAMEEAVERFHGIAAPYYAAMSIRLQQTGRAWAYVPEIAPFVSGFCFGKEGDEVECLRAYLSGPTNKDEWHGCTAGA